MDKLLLVIGGGIESIPGILIAKKLGIKVLVSDMNPNAPAFEICDYKIIASTYDYLKTSELAKSFSIDIKKIDGVLSLAADVPYTVSWVAKELNIPYCNSLETAKLSSNKYEMKKEFKNNNIPIPGFWKIETLDELIKIVKTQGLPLVIKPFDGRGARGVFILNELKQVDKYFQESKKYSKINSLLVEQYLEGPQISTEAVIINSIGYPIGFCDRNYEYLKKYSPYIIENGGDMPTSLSEIDKVEIEQTAIKAGLALGVKNGIVKGDMVLTKEGPKVIEIATRLSGGYFSSDQIPLNTDINIVEYAIKIALGIDFDSNELLPTANNGVAIRYFFPKPGKVINIKNLDFIENKDYIHKFHLFVEIGDLIEEMTDHTKRAGFVITTGKSKVEAVSRAEEIINTINIETL